MPDDLLDWLPRGLLDRTLDAVLITDAELEPPGPRIRHANTAWERMTGYHLGDVRGCSPRILQGPETERAELDRLRQCLEAGRGFEGKVVNYRADGTANRIYWSVEPIHDPAGELAGFGSIQRSLGAAGSPYPGDALDVIRELRTLIDDAELDVATARRRVARAAMHLAGAEAGVVEEADGESMVYRAAAGAASGLEGLRLPLAGSASGYCFASRRALLIGDSLTDERVELDQQAQTIGFRSGVLVPLAQGERRFGVLKVFSGAPHAFREPVCDFLGILAGLLAAILYRAQAYEIESRRRRHLVDALPMLVAYIDRDRRYREVNAAYADWFGWPVSEILGRHVWEIAGASAYEQVRAYMDEVLARGEAVSHEDTVTFPDGRSVTVSVDYSPDRRPDGRVAGFYALVRDVTKARAADLDHLTGLPNRRRFEEEAIRQLELCRRHERSVSLIIADVDRFKWWNDTWGHASGDRILETIAQHLRDHSRAGDLVARWGGEEFVILAPETTVDSAVVLAERIRRRLATTCAVEGRPVTLSLGVAEARGEAPSLGELMRDVDHALYRAKNLGRNRVARAAPEP